MWRKLKKKKKSMNFDDLTPPPDDYSVNYNREEEYRRGDEEEDHLECEEDDQKNLGIKGNPDGEDVVDEDSSDENSEEEDPEPDGEEDDELMEDGSDGDGHDFFIIRPFKSQYSLRTILLENGLSVLMVSNPTLALSSAAMSALKLFGNMFKCPCILEEHIGDEIKSINQEFHMQTNDSVRLARILSQTTRKDHIINRFGCGNKESFSAHGHPSICNSILELIGSHIVGSNMKLVIVSPASFKHLEAHVKLNFDDLKVGSEFTPFPKHNNYKWMRHGLWDSSVAYEVESGENSQKMVISWMLPSVSMSSAEERPERLIQQLISEESDGSLSFFFK